MRKAFAAALVPAFMSIATAAQESKYSTTDLHRIMHERGDGICETGCGAYVSANGWLYDVRFHSDYPAGRLFIAGINNHGKYTTLDSSPVDNPEIKKVFDTSEDWDLMARSFGPEIGDDSVDSAAKEYFGIRGGEIQIGLDISTEYREAYAKVINDIATAIVKSRK